MSVYVKNLICFALGAISSTLITIVVLRSGSASCRTDGATEDSVELYNINGEDICEFDRMQLNNIVRDGDSLTYLTRWVKVESEMIDYYYRQGDSVYWSNAYQETRKNVPAIQGADAETFMVAKGTDYAKDKNNVYYPEGINYWDNYDSEWPEGRISPIRIVQGADPKTFRCLGYSFAMDKTQMFFEGRYICWNPLLFNPENCRIFNSIWSSMSATWN